MQSRQTLRLYWATVSLCVVLLGWWGYFFSRQGHILLKRIEKSGQHLDEGAQAAVRKAADHTLRMFVFEGGFLGLLLVASVALVVRSLRREIAVNRQQRNFLSAVTHELRSPLASARLYLESIALGRATGEKQARYLKNAQEDLDRLRRLVEEMLECARLSDGRAVLKPEGLELGALVRERVAMVERLPGGSGVHIEVTTAGPAWVDADREALGKVVDNLLSNALKYGGPEPAIEVGVHARDGLAVLDVRDHGPGLAGADPRQIFEPFVRGGDEDVSRRPGVGLGLFLVAQLVQAHGGRASAVDGLPGGGSRFRVELPLGASPAPFEASVSEVVR